jgi:hypothetical protein
MPSFFIQVQSFGKVLLYFVCLLKTFIDLLFLLFSLILSSFNTCYKFVDMRTSFYKVFVFFVV